MHLDGLEVDMASSFFHRAPRLARDPNSPNVPMGGSKNEVLYVLAALGVLAIIALAFWFQAMK